jgi:hypothetical protein
MKRWISWISASALLATVALAQTGCGTSTGVVRGDQTTDDGTYASPGSVDYPGRPTFPPHSEGP